MDWKKIIEGNLEKESNKIASINLEKATVKYSGKVKQNRTLKKLTGDEEIVRAFLIDRLVNELGYRPENIELEKEYIIKGGHSIISPRIDLLVKDNNGNPFFFIEIKAPNKYEEDKKEIEGQLFSLAQAEENNYNTKVSYMVYYTVELVDNKILDRAIIIDNEKYRSYREWEEEGFISAGTEITAGYGEPKKQPFIKGHDKYDLRLRINTDEIDALSKNLHDVLWGGGGTNDSEIFYSLVNIILAKIQDEYEREDGEEYKFQVYQYGDHIESGSKFYNRINGLYKRALREQLNITEQQRIDDDSVINRNKFPINKLFYTVQALEGISFLEGRSSLDGKDILGTFFENITRDGFKQNKGQFFTPTPIVNFLLYALQLDKLAIDKLNDDRELPLIIDPSAGSGTFLIEAMKIITKELKYKQKNKISTSNQAKKRFGELFMPNHNENKWAKEYLYGCEINFDLGTASKVNMILHGDGSTNIFVKDGLLPFRFYQKEKLPNYLEISYNDINYFEKEINGKFDVVISNPPFSVNLDTQTKREVENTFLFGGKKNSENLFIERYYQLLREGGRLGVVLPESVFDTTENKYIRLFLFKYFNIKAVISLPQLTFEPYTSTKTSLLLAQKKTAEDIRQWNELWDNYGREWSLLKTRVSNYFSYYVEGKSINNRWAKDVVKDIKEDNYESILRTIRRFLKDYYTQEDDELNIKELLVKYQDEINVLSKYERETDIFGFYNAWWVFSEVSKELNYNIFMAEAENVGYKRSKRGELPMPNDLFDIEYAPNRLPYIEIIKSYENKIQEITNEQHQLNLELIEIKNKENVKDGKSNLKKIDRLEEKIENKSLLIKQVLMEKREVEAIINKYYKDGIIRDEYYDRIDPELISYFKDGILSEYRSNDILLRKGNPQNILDEVRRVVVWE